MFTAHLIVTILAAAANIFSSAIGCFRKIPSDRSNLSIQFCWLRS